MIIGVDSRNDRVKWLLIMSETISCVEVAMDAEWSLSKLTF